MKYFILLIFLFYLSKSHSQSKSNTSYTTASEYAKQVKKYPEIKIANAIPIKSIVETKDIEYFSSDNKKLYLDSYQFISDKKLPAVILIHGGGWTSGDKAMLQPMAYEISKAGYNCFSVNYSLSSEAIYPQGIKDILEAIKFVKSNAEKFNVDVSKIAVLGCSSGAQMASLIGTKYPEMAQVIVNLDGVLAFHHPQSSEGEYAAKWLGGSYLEKPEVWNEASALSHVSKNSPPILFINSQFERFHAGRDDMILKLNQYKIYSEIKEIKNSPHTFWLFEPWFEETMMYITQFLNKHIK